MLVLYDDVIFAILKNLYMLQKTLSTTPALIPALQPDVWNIAMLF